MAPNIERIFEGVDFGEGPHWDEATQTLYFVDMGRKAICRYVPATKKYTSAVVGADVAVIIPVRDSKDSFVVSMNRELAIVNWDGESDKITIIKQIVEVDKEPQKQQNHFNDGKCDHTGRLWIGTMGPIPSDGVFTPESASFFSIQKGKVTTLLNKVTLSNGIAFNTEMKKIYYIDSGKSNVEEYDVDFENGTIANGKPIFTMKNHPELDGGPDGMTIDTDGNLWFAIFRGSKIIKIDPRNPETILDTINIPTKGVTSLTFGGKDLNELYVTTAIFGEKNGGGIFRITNVNAKGFPANNYAQ